MITRFTNKFTGLIFTVSICLIMSCSSYDFSDVFSTSPANPQAGEVVTPVSYTHLTLPTILLV